MRKLLLVGLGLCLALEAGIFLLRRYQTSLLGVSRPKSRTA
jgi:hypothetical protein